MPKERRAIPGKPTKSNPRNDSATRQKVARLKKRFRRAHHEGMSALETGDYAALGKAIERERDIIDEQTVMLRAAGVLRARPAKRTK